MSPRNYQAIVDLALWRTAPLTEDELGQALKFCTAGTSDPGEPPTVAELVVGEDVELVRFDSLDMAGLRLAAFHAVHRVAALLRELGYERDVAREAWERAGGMSAGADSACGGAA